MQSPNRHKNRLGLRRGEHPLRPLEALPIHARAPREREPAEAGAAARARARTVRAEAKAVTAARARAGRARRVGVVGC